MSIVTSKEIAKAIKVDNVWIYRHFFRLDTNESFKDFYNQ